MADSGFSKRDDDFFDNDPFAELTRIMGHDPRASQPKQPVASEPDLDDMTLDLERELMGGYAGDEPVHVPDAGAGEATAWQAPQDAPPAWEPAPEHPSDAVGDEHSADAIGDLDAEFDRRFEEELSSGGQAAPHDWSAQSPAAADYESRREPDQFETAEFEPEEFEAAEFETTEFERAGAAEGLAAEPSWQATERAQTFHDEHAEPEDMPQPAASGALRWAPQQPSDTDEQPWAAADDLPLDLEDEPQSSASFDERAGAWDESMPAYDAPGYETPADDFMAEVDMDFGDLDLASAEEEEPSGVFETRDPVGAQYEPRDAVGAQYEPRDAIGAQYDAAEAIAEAPSAHPDASADTHWDASPQAAPQDALSFEDELSMLLGDEQEAPVASPVPVAAAAAVAPAFGRSTAFGYHRPEAPAEPARWQDAPAQLPHEDAAADFGEADASSGDDGGFGFEETDFDTADLVPVEAAADDEALYDEPHRDEPARDPFASLTRLAPAAAPGAASAGEDALDLDLVDVPETSIAVADDLDLPDIPEDDEPARGDMDELESEFAEVFRLDDADPAGAQDADAANGQFDAHEDYFNEAMGGAAAGLAYAGASAAGATASAYRPYAGGMADGADDGYDADLDREIALPPAAGAAPRRRNNLVIAAAVAGVALLGAIGLFAFSGGSDTSDAPALVRAGGEPMKVRPENPGGATVPNQDSEAYQRAAGGAGDTVPAQESLVTGSEEPVDLAAREAAEIVAPGVEIASEGLPGVGLPGVGLPGVGLPAKDDERLTVEDTASAEDVAPEMIAVTPRRVRTMIVRPDGTLVPREEVAEAEPEANSQTASAGTATGPTAAPLVENAQPLTPAGQPQQPAAAQPPAQAAPQPTPAARPAQQQQVAAAPSAPRTQPAAPAPTAATGEWSMQIASQPTAEGAQASYQDLARRYSSLLSGRGVNIVRAEIEGRGTYYRVRIPSATRDEAISLCERYKSAGGSCFVSR